MKRTLLLIFAALGVIILLLSRSWNPKIDRSASATTPAPTIVNELEPQADVTIASATDSASATTSSAVRPEAVFATPIVRFGPSSDEAARSREEAGLRALENRYISLGGANNPASARAIGDYLEENPASPYAVTLLQEKASIEWRHGFFTDGLASLDAAWELGKKADGLDQKRVTEAGLSELLTKTAALGRKDRLRQLLAEVENRPIGGMLAERIYRAEEKLWFFENQAEENIFCGFTAANEIAGQLDQPRIYPDVHDEAEKKEFIANGLSLYELRAHNREASGDLRIIKRAQADAPLPVPSVIHWNFGHYSSVTDAQDGRYRVKDFHLKFDSWVPREAIDEEASGYLLASADGPVPKGFVAVSDAEAKTVFGRHCNHGRDDEGGDPDSGRGGNGGNNGIKGNNPDENKTDCPMATYSFRLMNPGLQVFDTPIFYRPAYGPLIALRVEYDQRSTVIPDLATHSNFGPRWTHQYNSYIAIVGTGSPAASVDVVFGDGNFFRYSYDTRSGAYTTKYSERARLQFLTAAQGGPGYRLVYADGSSTDYTQPNAGGTRFYLKALKDSSGNALTVAYDTSLRIMSLTDAVGGVTAFGYDGAGFKVSSVTDPAGRKAEFTYDANGRLQSIKDPVGIISQFTYGDGDFLNKLTTPYGATTFVWDNLPGINQEPGRYIEATDPAGDKERAEATDFAALGDDQIAQAANFLVRDGQSRILVDPLPAPSSVNVAGQPVEFYPKTGNLYYRNTFYWDKWQMRLHAGDYGRATVYHWKAQNNEVTGVLESLKLPLQPRIWFNYPDQDFSEELGSSSNPSKIVRAVENAAGATTWTMVQREYNPTTGRLTKTIDPLGREVVYEYASNGIDLTAVKLKEGAAYRTIASFSDHVAYQPRKVTDAAGQITTYAYNAQGQVTSMTNPKGEVTALTYHTADESGKRRKGRVASIDGPLAGTTDVTTFDYDNAGNLAKVTGPDGYHLAMTYDAIDRLTRVTYPDGTFEQTTFTNLDATARRDRLGRVTTMVYNSLRQLVAVTDPANRKVEFIWCRCGALRQLTDAMGRATKWEYDIQGRQTYKEYADGSKVRYTYQPLSGRLASSIDEKGQVSKMAYNIDGTVAKQSYANAQRPTPDVSFTYDPDISRVLTMVDGTGTTAYAYNPIAAGTLGAGQLASVNGPLSNDTITYIYDQLGRRRGYAVNGVGETVDFDALGRVVKAVNALGAFDYTYVGATGRMQKADYPNGMSANFAYDGLTGDFRLNDLHYKLTDNSMVARFGYAYNAVGNITQWTQRLPAGSIARRWDITYDNVDQLTGIASRNPDTGTALPTGNYAYTYDKAGNRLTETIDGVTTTASYNALNQLVSMTGGNSASLPNLTYEWDANDRLLAIAYAGTDRRSEFVYDGLGRRTTVTEKTGNTVDSQNKFVWDGLAMLEQRDAAGSVVQKRYFGPGMETLEGGQLFPHLFARDHLGSVRSVLSGTTAAATIDYGPWGQRRVLINGTDPSSLAFTGHWLHSPSALVVAPYRAYTPWQGRWLSRDPLGEMADGPNLYSYVRNNSINNIDPTGEIGLVGAGFGFVTGFGFDIGLQMLSNYMNGSSLGCNLDYWQAAKSGAFSAAAGAVGVPALNMTGQTVSSLKNAARLQRNLGARAKAVQAGKYRNPRTTAKQLDQRNASLEEAANAATMGSVGPILNQVLGGETEEP
jgi:RHS repeat-associated protein